MRQKKMIIVKEKYCYKEEKELTVHKKTMFTQGDGFSVYDDSNGDVIFQVDFHCLPKHHGCLLMDSFGIPLLTLLPKRATLHHRLEAFIGENTSEDQQRIFSVHKSTIIGRSRLIVEVYDHETSHSSIEYYIEGSFAERNCTVFRVQNDAPPQLVTQVKPKVEPTRKMVLSSDVFSLVIQPGIDVAFAMGLVLALDKIDGNDEAASCAGCISQSTFAT